MEKFLFSENSKGSSRIKAPTCVPVCVVPSIIENGVINCADSDDGMVCDFSCDDDFTLIGDKQANLFLANGISIIRHFFSWHNYLSNLKDNQISLKLDIEMREFVIDSTYILDTITYDRFVMYKIIDKLNAYISASLARWLKLSNESRGM